MSQPNNLFIFGQLGFLPAMSEKSKHTKYNNRGKLVQNLRDIPNHVYVEETNGYIKCYRVANFFPFFTARDQIAAFARTLHSRGFENKDAVQALAQKSDDKKHQRTGNNTRRQWQQKPDKITSSKFRNGLCRQQRIQQQEDM